MKTLITLFLVGSFQLATAQDKSFHISSRAGNLSYGSGVSYNYNTSTIEGIISRTYDKSRTLLTITYQEHSRFFSSKKINWFVGVGLHAGVLRTSRTILATNNGAEALPRFLTAQPAENDVIVSNRLVTGADLIVGLRYSFSNKMTMNLDVKPYTDFLNGKATLGDYALRFSVPL
jgi:hypothetical protein